MRYLYLILTVLIFNACSKEDGYGPFDIKEGQEVELLISDRLGAIGDVPLLLPQNENPGLPVSGFDDREAGYIYKVKAKMQAYHGPIMMDGGSGHSLVYLKTLSKEKQSGDQPFEISLIQSIVPGPDIIWLQREEDQYQYRLSSGETIQLTYHDPKVGEQLAEIWEYIQQLSTDDYPSTLKWKAIRLTVTHDPENFGIAYLVSHIALTEAQ